jgi:hypothetical protein
MNTDGIQLAILALVAGMAIPLLVQLFLTARTVQRAAASIERNVEDVRRDLHGLVGGAARSGAPPEWAATLAGAAVPAVIAAVRAFRGSLAEDQPKTAGDGELQERAP